MRRWFLLGLLATLGVPAAHGDSFDDDRAVSGTTFDGNLTAGPASKEQESRKAPALNSLKASNKRVEAEPKPVPKKKKPATVPAPEAAEAPKSAAPLPSGEWAQDPQYKAYQRAIRDNQALDDAADELKHQDMAECDRRIALIRGSNLSASEQRDRIDCIEEQRRLLARIHRERRRAYGEQEDLLLKKVYQRVKDIQPEAIR